MESRTWKRQQLELGVTEAIALKARRTACPEEVGKRHNTSMSSSVGRRENGSQVCPFQGTMLDGLEDLLARGGSSRRSVN